MSNDFHTYITLLHNAGIKYEQRDEGAGRSRIIVKAPNKGQPTVHSCATFVQGRLIELGVILE